MPVTTPCPSHIKPEHWKEWVDESGVSPHLTTLNLGYYEGQEVIEALAGNLLESMSSHAQQYATRSVQNVLRRYEGPARGGWGVFSLAPESNWERDGHFRFKPDHPYYDQNRQRPVKYEGVAKAEARPVFLRTSLAESLLTAQRIKETHETAYVLLRERFLKDFFKARPETKTQEEQPKSAQQSAPGGDSDRQIQGCDLAFALARGRLSEVCKKLKTLPPIEDPHYWPWVERHNLPIAITEGEKKAGFLLSQGISAIALPGVHNAIRTRDADGCKLFEPYLVPDLKRFATKDREITVCFDHETRVKQRRALDSEIEKIKQHFGYEKAKTRVLELPGPEKGVDDFGVAHGADAFVELYDAAPNFELWTVQRYSRLSYPVAQSLNQRYLGDLNIPKTANLIALKSPKGTGKTESFKHLVEQATDQGQRTLLITHRVQLGQAICDRVALPYVTELRTTAEGDLLGYGVCVDSLHPNSQAHFNAEDWKDALIIIDECEQVIWHLLEGRTEIRQHRLEVLNQLQVLFDGVLNSDRGRIVLSDADLSDQSIRFIGDLVDRQTEVQPYVVVNSWQPSEPWQVYNYTQSKPEQWGAAMLRALDEGQRIMICTQSQKTKSRWSTTTLEALIAKRYPDRKVLRIDSQSVSDPQHPAYLCTAHLNEILPNYDVVICSPTIETGVSIDIRGHFHSLWACGQGVLSENSTRQFLARLRDPVPRHIWCQSFGVGRIANGATSIKGLLACQYKLAKQNANLLRYAAFGEDMLKSFSGTLYIWAVMGCRINSGAIHYRQAVMAALRREGHHIHTVEVVGCSITKALRMPTADGDHQYLDTELEVLDLKEELDEIKTVNHKAECEAIAGAEEITPKQYERLKAQKAKTQQQWHTQRKHEVGDRYQVEVTPDLVSKDSDGWYPKLKLFYYLTIGRPYLKQRDQGNFESEVKSGGAWLPTLNGSQMGLKVHLLRHLGVQQLRSPELLLHGGNRASDGEIEAGSRQHYDNCHPLLWKITQKARRYAWEVKAILGVTISEKMSPIQIVQSLLRKLDLKLEFVHQEGGRGDRQRYYCYSEPKDGRDPILARWAMADSARADAVHTPGNKDLYSQEAA